MSRIELEKLVPEAGRAVFGVEQYVRGAVEKPLLTLIKLRASYVNGCAYCIDSHATEGLAAGETSRRLFGVAAWEDTEFFTEAERAALRLTDEVTRIGDGGVSDETWRRLQEHYDDAQIADLIVAATTINMWNRLNIAVRKAPGA